jgi:hypothetical protein
MLCFVFLLFCSRPGLLYWVSNLDCPIGFL